MCLLLYSSLSFIVILHPSGGAHPISILSVVVWSCLCYDWYCFCCQSSSWTVLLQPFFNVIQCKLLLWKTWTCHEIIFIFIHFLYTYMYKYVHTRVQTLQGAQWDMFKLSIHDTSVSFNSTCKMPPSPPPHLSQVWPYGFLLSLFASLK